MAGDEAGLMSHEIEADRTTDARIAVEVMGWRWMAFRPEVRVLEGERRRFLAPDDPFIARVAESDVMTLAPYANATERARPYSTDISAAFEVVEKLTKAGLWLRVEFRRGHADVIVLRGMTEIAAASSGSLPPAIARAALAPEVLAHLRTSEPHV